MSDILADYREWRDQQAARVSTHSDRCHLWHEQCMIHRLAAALERARLTDAEREAISYFAGEHCRPGDDQAAHIATLRGLLERTK